MLEKQVKTKTNKTFWLQKRKQNYGNQNADEIVE